jgi:hypothetical protein
VCGREGECCFSGFYTGRLKVWVMVSMFEGRCKGMRERGDLRSGRPGRLRCGLGQHAVEELFTAPCNSYTGTFFSTRSSNIVTSNDLAMVKSQSIFSFSMKVLDAWRWASSKSTTSAAA